MIILRKDRGFEARHGAKALDPQGRLKFHFQTFVSFNDAHRYVSFLYPPFFSFHADMKIPKRYETLLYICLRLLQVKVLKICFIDHCITPIDKVPFNKDCH